MTRLLYSLASHILSEPTTATKRLQRETFPLALFAEVEERSFILLILLLPGDILVAEVRTEVLCYSFYLRFPSHLYQLSLSACRLHSREGYIVKIIFEFLQLISLRSSMQGRPRAKAD
jgi:hypothetical protein